MICRNCGQETGPRFCGHCGQEAVSWIASWFTGDALVVWQILGYVVASFG